MGIWIVLAVIVIFITLAATMSRYRRCPADKILVRYGRVGKEKSGAGRSADCIHGGAAFVWPVIQDYQYLDLKPMSIEVNLTNALSRQNIRVDVPSRFTVGISTEEGIMQNAAERLLGLTHEDIKELAKDILFGQLRLVIATMDIEEINADRDMFLMNVSQNVEAELKKIGLKLINVNVTDIMDESGYIEALGKEAAAKAINDARRTVAEKNRDGSIGEANAQRDERVQVAEANSIAVEGENEAKVTIANSEATRRERAAEAERRAAASEKVQAAKALEESYLAEEEAERARAKRERATKEADIVVNAQIEKERIEIDAEAEAEKTRRHAKGEADAILFKMQAEADGINEILSKRAAGFKKLVDAAGGDAQSAVSLMITDKLEDLVKAQVEAIKGIKIDKVTVWDNLGGGDGNGAPSTAKFLSGMLKSLPPFEDVFNMAGMELPDMLKGKSVDELKADIVNDFDAKIVESDDEDNESDSES
ncbi:flotillin family protein [Haloplasma contractile]|uniref:Flotillin-like protein n=1 Tax=Haloplasma contractile SSD-17B TaxID=1033810 RepID=U2FIW9_9MOLU|nr:flotillin family protein [Haloplasma contractile]ERJ11209.1 Flotillin-like protein [Haloplasma contractile SSD-17B]